MLILKKIKIHFRNMINEKLEKGMHQYTFSAKKLGLPAGIYNVKLNINGVITSKNMIELE